ncbi:MAG: SPOR domain-containing protein [Bacteroidota bacterium]|nr:SPOR domain-containing protein [Bacteroidota bacterium]
MLVEKYIKRLLYTEDCIVIPGFGSFVTHYAGAEISIVRNRITPPYKLIAFNDKLLTDNEKLVNAIADGEQISIQQAELEIFNYIRIVKQSLVLQKQYTFDEIGKLYFNKEGLLNFEQFTKYNYLSESFGLPELYFKTIDRTNEKPVIFNSQNAKKMVKDNEEYEENQEETSEEKEYESSENSFEDDDDFEYSGKKKKKSSLALYYIGAAVALFLVIGTSIFINSGQAGKNLDLSSIFSKLTAGDTTNKSGDNKLLPEEETTSNDQLSDGETNNADIPSEAPASEPITSNSSSQVSSEADQRANISDAINTPQGKFYVIAGSFMKVKKASRLSTKMNNNGQPSRLIISGDENEPVKVSIGEFGTYEEATAKKEELKQIYGSDLWVFNY